MIFIAFSFVCQVQCSFIGLNLYVQANVVISSYTLTLTTPDEICSLNSFTVHCQKQGTFKIDITEGLIDGREDVVVKNYLDNRV